MNGQQVTQSNQSKRQKRQHDSDSDSDSITVISSGSVSASSSRPAHPARSPPSAAAKAAAHPSLVPKASKPPTESEMAWEAIEGELKRILQQVNRTPISTVQRLFKLLHSKRFVTDNSGGEKSKGMEMLSVPPEGRQMILSVLRERSNGDFDECFVTDPRAPSLLEVWVRDLSDLAKKGPSSNPDARALSATGLPLLEVSHFLSLSLPSLKTRQDFASFATDCMETAFLYALVYLYNRAIREVSHPHHTECSKSHLDKSWQSPQLGRGISGLILSKRRPVRTFTRGLCGKHALFHISASRKLRYSR